MMEKVFDEIRKERARQDAKWGIQNHTPPEWLSILGEEFGEVCKAVCEAHFPGYQSTGNWNNYREELIQTAAVCVSMVQNLDRNRQQEFLDRCTEISKTVTVVTGEEPYLTFARYIREQRLAQNKTTLEMVEEIVKVRYNSRLNPLSYNQIELGKSETCTLMQDIIDIGRFYDYSMSALLPIVQSWKRLATPS